MLRWIRRNILCCHVRRRKEKGTGVYLEPKKNKPRNRRFKVAPAAKEWCLDCGKYLGKYWDF